MCVLYDKMKNKENNSLGTVPKSYNKIVETDQIDIPRATTIFLSGEGWDFY